ncbi:MAG: cytochrome c family protein [Candidatus Zhuqueibacterota bacterium]
MKKVVVLLMAVAVLAMVVSSFAQDAKFKYIGVAKCKMCHKGEKKGSIFEKWQQTTHAKAYETLTTDAALEVAKKAGVKGEPQNAKECLVCHVTGYDAAKEPTLTLEEGNSCEACHGPGSEYKSLKIMKGIYDGTMKGADYGLIEPTKEVCVKCHNPKSPTYKEFKFEEAVKKIAHPLPKAE